MIFLPPPSPDHLSSFELFLREVPFRFPSPTGRNPFPFFDSALYLSASLFAMPLRPLFSFTFFGKISRQLFQPSNSLHAARIFHSLSFLSPPALDHSSRPVLSRRQFLFRFKPLLAFGGESQNFFLSPLPFYSLFTLFPIFKCDQKLLRVIILQARSHSFSLFK